MKRTNDYVLKKMMEAIQCFRAGDYGHAEQIVHSSIVENCIDPAVVTVSEAILNGFDMPPSALIRENIHDTLNRFEIYYKHRHKQTDAIKAAFIKRIRNESVVLFNNVLASVDANGEDMENLTERLTNIKVTDCRPSKPSLLRPQLLDARIR